jgi:hypothetical protein
MAMKKNLILGAIMLLFATFWFTLDAGVAAMMFIHSTDRTIVEVRSNVG